MSASLCAALLLASWPAAAIERLSEIPRVPSTPEAVVPQGPFDLRTPPNLALPQVGAVTAPLSVETPTLEVDGPAPIAVQPTADVISAAPQINGPGSVLSPEKIGPNSSEGPLPAEVSADAAADPTQGWVESSRRFDNAGKAPRTAVVLGGAAATVAAGAALAPHLHALAPFLNAASYDAANILSVAFPLPDAYAAFRRGNAKGVPLRRAILGAVGTLSLGLINATVLGKPLWGVMHTFISLGILAPYIIGKTLESKGPMARNKALLATAVVGALMLAASAGLYFGAAAVVPALLAAHMSAAAVAQLLFWLQVAKGAMFVSMFAPDIADLLRGKPTHGFSRTFTAIYLASVAAFTAWGFSQAAVSPAGPIREQYVVLGVRNLIESVASALSLVAIQRALNAKRRGDSGLTAPRPSH